MEELILNDENYKNSVVVTYVMMQTRAQQFGGLVDMSNEGSDQLKLVRDQWVGYQMMTASLEGDSNLEKEMADKEILLSVAESSAALNGFKTNNVPIMEMTGMGSFTGLGIIALRYNDKANATLLNMPQISQSFNGVVLGIREVGGTGEAINISDNMFANQIGVMIQSIANGEVGSLSLITPQSNL